MGNFISNQYVKFKEPTITTMYYEAYIQHHKNKGKNYCLLHDRILDAENQIYIGIGSDVPDQKEISLQAIRIGDYTNKYYRLLQFTEDEHKLKYEFEDGVTLTLSKFLDVILIELSQLKKKTVIISEVNPIIIKHFKPINFVSDEFDKIYDLFKNVSTK